MAELSAEVRCLTVSAQALMTEAEQAVVSLPSRTSSGRVVFPLMAMAPTASRSMGGLTDVLTEREMKIASRLAAGCSNRQIAEELFLAPSTIKGCVARILRKLDASNRAEAAARYLQMTQASA
jgi:DNA-binding NarL/FixJ family response regulator